MTEARKLLDQAKNAVQTLHAQNPIVGYSVAFGVLVLMLGISWVLINTMRTVSIDRPGNVVSAVVAPVLDDGQVNRITIPIDTDTLRLDLIIEGDAYRSYRAVLLRDDGAEAWRREDLKLQNQMGNRFIVVNIPASALTTGYYQIKVSGKLPNDTFEDVDDYRFGAVK